MSQTAVSYLLTEGHVDVAVLVNLVAELSNFVTALLHLFVNCVSNVAVILLAANQRFLKLN